MKEKPRKLVFASVELKNLRNRRPLSVSLSMNALATEFSTVFCEHEKNQDIQFHLKIFKKPSCVLKLLVFECDDKR